MKSTMKLAAAALLATLVAACDNAAESANKLAEKTQETAQQVVEKAQETTQAVADQAKATTEQMTDKAQAATQAVMDKAQEASQQLTEKAQAVTQAVSEKVDAGVESVKAQAEEAVKNVAEVAGKADFEAFKTWQEQQEKGLSVVVENALKNLGDKANDAKLAEETVNKTVLSYFEQVKKEAANLTFKDPDVQALKAKTLEILDLGGKMLVEVNGKAEMTPEVQKAQEALQAQIEKAVEEGKQLQEKLINKYEPVAK